MEAALFFVRFEVQGATVVVLQRGVRMVMVVTEVIGDRVEVMQIVVMRVDALDFRQLAV